MNKCIGNYFKREQNTEVIASGEIDLFQMAGPKSMLK